AFASSETIHWLRQEFAQGKNLLISGGTGAGKTTLLSCLLDTARSEERLIIVEETSEIRLRHPHAVFLESRPATPDGVG
ncbi:ATPase, T2SS/T4P/T4SS family, partial [Pseudomonas protegens]|uniref:ATPase, T2SS/T4P/T4SS family n=1 Tax=Pseudomonas protegens TaxID=380021 RepID=UPI0034D679ED